MKETSIHRYFKHLDDPRLDRRKKYPLMNAIKSYASRHLNKANLDGDRVNRWARHGSTRYLWKEAAVEAAIQYVVNEQGLPMSVLESKNRTFSMVI